MRMTNKIMQNNSLYNINNNKILQDKLSTMMATQKKTVSYTHLTLPTSAIV